MQFGVNAISNKQVYIIAEIGNNHNGCLDAAKQLVDCAACAGADCAKFQMRQLDAVYREKTLSRDSEDLGVEYVLDLLQKYELTTDQHKELYDYTIAKGLDYICTPWDNTSADILNSFPVNAFKVASADFTNLFLLEHLISFNKPLILSTGMSSEDEIKKVVSWLNKKSAIFTLLHCNSTYPAPFDDINLLYIQKLKKLHPYVGYSGHERGIGVSIGAVALGAMVIERHLTLDKELEGPDHQASLEPQEFTLLVKSIRELTASIGTAEASRKVSQGELINRENLGKSLVAATDLTEGTTVLREHIAIKSPGQGLAPIHLEELIGKKTVRSFQKEDYFFPSDIQQSLIKPEIFDFTLPWGVPVRFHDFERFNAICKPNLWEFHLSYSDLDLDWRDLLIEPRYEADFVVHAPELFADSHLLDLASLDEEYLTQSIRNLQNVVVLTKAMRSVFSSTDRTLIVTNVGGFSTHDFISEELKAKKYQILENSLALFEDDEVEIIPQTMAPFPWHFGGQRYQNLFMLPDDTIAFIAKTGHRLCLDVSHSWLTCNYFGISFDEFIASLGPHSAHLHLADALGTNGEGLRFGDGEISVPHMAELISKYCQGASFIPEIWQGHKNSGEGFWDCLKLLSGKI